MSEDPAHLHTRPVAPLHGLRLRRAAARVTAGSILPDVLASGLRLVVCGSAAGRVSAARGCYYAGPGNKFWRALAAIGLTDEVLAPSAYARVLEFRIGLTDLVQDQSGADHEIDFARAGRDALRARITRFEPAVLCFNGKRAAREFLGRQVAYGAQTETIGPTRVFVAPSTSGAASASWDLAIWQELSVFVRSRDPARSRARLSARDASGTRRRARSREGD